jgi:orotidine-5'-phosphate decarboxylase
MIKEKIILALDVESAGIAREIVTELRGEVGAFKIGLQLFSIAGPEFVRELTEDGNRIFLDLKFHDIPNTVAKASAGVARLGVWMFNLHAIGGSEMMRRTISEVSEVCARENIVRPKIIGVTLLTSLNSESLAEIGISGKPEREVLRLAKLCRLCGLDGIVSSPNEVLEIRREIADRDFLVVTPGIRTDFATNDDQRRVMTAADALAAGSDYLVIGRPILREENRRGTIRSIVRECENASRSATLKN